MLQPLSQHASPVTGDFQSGNSGPDWSSFRVLPVGMNARINSEIGPMIECYILYLTTISGQSLVPSLS